MSIFQGFFTWIWTLFLPCFPVFEQKLIYAPPRGGGFRPEYSPLVSSDSVAPNTRDRLRGITVCP